MALDIDKLLVKDPAVFKAMVSAPSLNPKP